MSKSSDKRSPKAAKGFLKGQNVTTHAPFSAETGTQASWSMRHGQSNLRWGKHLLIWCLFPGLTILAALLLTWTQSTQGTSHLMQHHGMHLHY